MRSGPTTITAPASCPGQLTHTPNSFTMKYRALESPLTAAVSARSAFSITNASKILLDERSFGQRPVSQVVHQHRSFAPGLSDAGRNLRDVHIGPPAKHTSQEKLHKVSTIPKELFPFLSRQHDLRPGVLGIPLVPRHTLRPRASLPQALFPEDGQQQLMIVHRNVSWHALTAERNAHDIPLASAKPCRT